MTSLSQRYGFNDDIVFLPGNMKRIGYDADTERYLFREGDDLWEGEPGSYYGGKMRWVGKAPVSRRSTPSSRDQSKDGSDNFGATTVQSTALPGDSYDQESKGLKKLANKTVAAVQAVRRMSTRRRQKASTQTTEARI